MGTVQQKMAQLSISEYISRFLIDLISTGAFQRGRTCRQLSSHLEDLGPDKIDNRKRMFNGKKGNTGLV